ncbi:MAG: hypothetical protein KDK70_19630 [Myxococcales bacterium]|nr:hypothetical protein [Myxococcales bacterium]
MHGIGPVLVLSLSPLLLPLSLPVPESLPELPPAMHSSAGNAPQGAWHSGVTSATQPV